MANIKRISNLDYVVFVMDFSEYWDPSRFLKDDIREHLSVVCECEDVDECTCNDRLVCFKDVISEYYTEDTSDAIQIENIIKQNHDRYLIMKCSSVREAVILSEVLVEEPYEFCELTNLSLFEFIEIGNKKTLLMSFCP